MKIILFLCMIPVHFVFAVIFLPFIVLSICLHVALHSLLSAGQRHEARIKARPAPEPVTDLQKALRQAERHMGVKR